MTITPGTDISPRRPLSPTEQRPTALHQHQDLVATKVKRRAIPPLPKASTRPSYALIISFVLCVIIPIIAAASYYGFYASNQYVAEFRFSVKETSTSNSSAASVMPLMGTTGIGGSIENYLVVDYLLSRQAVEDLQRRIRVTERYSRPEVDSLSRFNAADPMEKFVSYWHKMVSTHYDQVTGIASAQVRAFTPGDALLIAETLVTLSEDLVNRIANRTRHDAVRFAENEVERAQERLRRVRMQLTERHSRTAVATNNAASTTGESPGLLLDLERQTAQNMLASAMQSLDQARANAAVQHLYITPYVRPSLPQSSTYPQKYLLTALVGAIAFAVWICGLLVTRSIFERFG